MGQIRWIRDTPDGKARPQYRQRISERWQNCRANFQPAKKHRQFLGPEESPGFFHFCWLLSVGYEHVIESSESKAA
jgi:hypothetical protein